jgi:hypothetical protein
MQLVDDLDAIQQETAIKCSNFLFRLLDEDVGQTREKIASSTVVYAQRIERSCCSGAAWQLLEDRPPAEKPVGVRPIARGDSDPESARPRNFRCREPAKRR